MPPKSSKKTKRSKGEDSHECPICEEAVKDPSAESVGDDGVFCDGECQEWLHRRCANLSMSRFKAVRQSADPFLCPQCRLANQEKEIQSLKHSLDYLTSELASMKDTMTSFSSELTSARHEAEIRHPRLPDSKSVQRKSYASVILPRTSAGNKDDVHASISNNTSSTGSGKAGVSYDPHLADSAADDDRRLNIVVRGIPECAKGQPRKQRWISDLRNVSNLFNESSVCVPKSAIRDCRRLGKFSDDWPRPRPILVCFNSCNVVMDILQKRSLFNPFVIKPDLPVNSRQREKVLLKERWSLIQSGSASKSEIKIKRNSILVRDSLYGKVDPQSYKFIHHHNQQDEDQIDVNTMDESDDKEAPSTGQEPNDPHSLVEQSIDSVDQSAD